MTEPTPDPMDQPDDETYELAVPFIVCQSQGGPYEDDAFVAGFQAGEIDRSLLFMAQAGATAARFTVRTELLPQIELLGMNRGWPVMNAQDSGADGWSYVELTTGDDAQTEES